MTNGVTFGWLRDVYIARPLNLNRLMLATSVAHEVYSKVGFESLADPDTMMVLGPDET